MKSFIREIAPLVHDSRRSKVWILGDGPSRFKIFNSLKHQGLHYQILLPGIFTEPTELLQAADLCILPAQGVGLSWWAQICAKSRIPMLVANSSEAQELFAHNTSHMLYSPETPLSLRKQIRDWMHDPSLLERDCIGLQDALIRRTGTVPDTAEILRQILASLT